MKPPGHWATSSAPTSPALPRWPRGLCWRRAAGRKIRRFPRSCKAWRCGPTPARRRKPRGTGPQAPLPELGSALPAFHPFRALLAFHAQRLRAGPLRAGCSAGDQKCLWKNVVLLMWAAPEKEDVANPKLL